jgi:hypothetical protein
MKKYLTGIAILAIGAALLAYGLHGFPLWLQWVGYLVGATYIIGGSLFLSIGYVRGNHISRPQLALFPRSWQRWIMDEEPGRDKK